MYKIIKIAQSFICVRLLVFFLFIYIYLYRYVYFKS